MRIGIIGIVKIPKGLKIPSDPCASLFLCGVGDCNSGKYIHKIKNNTIVNYTTNEKLKISLPIELTILLSVDKKKSFVPFNEPQEKNHRRTKNLKKSKTKTATYCICKKGTREPMIECEHCGTWFHWDCVQIPNNLYIPKKSHFFVAQVAVIKVNANCEYEIVL